MYVTYLLLNNIFNLIPLILQGLYFFNHTDMNTPEMLVKILEGKRLSSEERLSLAKDLVAENVQDILSKKMLVASQGGQKRVDITLSADECRDSDEDIRNFLWLLGCKKISVSSDFPGYNESYTGRTTIKFKI